MELINCTPHDVVIFTPYGGKKTIKEVRDDLGRIIGCRGLGFFQ